LVYDLRQRTRVEGPFAEPFEATLDGTVTAQAEGSVPDEVLAIDANDEAVLDPASTRWLRLDASDGRAWMVVAENVPLAFGVLDCSPALAHFAFSLDSQDRVHIALTVTVAGQLAYHFARDDMPGTLMLPAGVIVVQARALCQHHDTCLDYTLYALSVAIESANAVLATDEQQALGA